MLFFLISHLKTLNPFSDADPFLMCYHRGRCFWNSLSVSCFSDLTMLVILQRYQHYFDHWIIFKANLFCSAYKPRPGCVKAHLSKKTSNGAFGIMKKYILPSRCPRFIRTSHTFHRTPDMLSPEVVTIFLKFVLYEENVLPGADILHPK